MLIACTRIAFPVGGFIELTGVGFGGSDARDHDVTSLNLRLNSHLDVREGRQLGLSHLLYTVTA